jgi:hypothetical protein
MDLCFLIVVCFCVLRIASWSNVKAAWKSKLKKSRQSHIFMTGIVVSGYDAVVFKSNQVHSLFKNYVFRTPCFMAILV